MQQRGTGARPRWRRRALVIAVVVAAAVLQRGRIAELPEAATALLAARPGWIAVVAAASAISYVMAAFAMIGTVGPRVPFGAALLVQVATGAATLAAPAGLGSAGLNVWYLEREGLPRHEAVTSAVLNGLAGGAVHVVGMAIAFVSLSHLVARPSVPPVVDGPLPVAAAALALVTVTTGLTVAVRRLPRATADLRASVLAGWSTARRLLRRGDRLAPLIGGSVGLTLANGFTLWASAQALGLPIDLPTAIAIELTVEALAGLSPTPGGAGVAEAAGIHGLILVGASPATAIAVVLLHRAATTWLPALPGVLALRRLRAPIREPSAGPHVAVPQPEDPVVDLTWSCSVVTTQAHTGTSGVLTPATCARPPLPPPAREKHDRQQDHREDHQVAVQPHPPVGGWIPARASVTAHVATTIAVNTRAVTSSPPRRTESRAASGTARGERRRRMGWGWRRRLVNRSRTSPR
jgi:uncharacterized membrane protein YbhN (UPF0104 family)